MTDEELAKKKEELLRMLDEEPPFDKEKFKADMAVGRTYEWVQLCENGLIEISTSQWFPNGARGHGTSQAVPGNPEYEAIRARHKLEKTGDTSGIWKKLVAGKWIIEKTDP